MSQKWVDDVIMTIDDVIGCRFGKMRSVWKSNRRIWNTMWEEEEYYFLKSKFKKFKILPKIVIFSFLSKKKIQAETFSSEFSFFLGKNTFLEKKITFFGWHFWQVGSPDVIEDISFVPYEDVLGIGRQNGVSR